ncbi:Snf2-like DNA helicase [Chloropicon primus]|uniref:Chromatin-remodeling ATPase INO80 n=2 Tax=Chloropicon primus TaxID=1764295 RepID=A0A5B8MG05_9CHLO|nr:Snf2-like DNA helicase [Chloropicon primus]|eukprot:QDZ19317.1 Snf2-like DNA helicase [Chloropicon primus]
MVVRVKFKVLAVAEPEAEGGSAGANGVAERVAVTIETDKSTPNKRRRLPSLANGFLVVDDKGLKYPIPLFYDDLVNEDASDLPAYGMLSVDENLWQQEGHIDYDKLRVSLKKKRRRIDKAPSSFVKNAAQRGSQSSGKEPPQDINSPEIQAYIAENIKFAEGEMIKRAYKRLVINSVSKHHRIVNMYFKKQQNVLEKVAAHASRETQQRFFKVQKESTRSQQRMRRLVREMMFYWKKQGKGSARERKQADREAAEARKREEEAREEKRKQQQLNFLLTQTELYAHFMAKKIGHEQPDPLADKEGKLEELKGEEKEEEEEMHQKATAIASMCVSQTRLATQTFDHESERLRLEATGGSMQNPSTMPTLSDVQQPKGLKGQLKGYQLKGLQWLANIYEQGLNGILADEMGLGKTVQAIALLAYLAEEKNIKGPFLVVAPGSTLHNWDREIQGFFPQFKVLPYWGNKAQRKEIRPCIHPKKLYGDNAHNVIVTSYDIILKDEMQLKRIKWQFMILDEAQAIKNADSFRWKILLSFSCRNRLLLTGTPIQNNMAELWALLHFIMPTLFDSHEEFNEWFSKGIEDHAVGAQSLNEHQLKRLHTVLQPFMLRRVKKDVENEMPPKKEVVIPCHLTMRQKELYRRIRDKISIVDLFEGKSLKNLNDGKVSSLMNIVMQLRKVCNHPELFEQQKEITPYHFAEINLPLEPAPWGETDWAWCSGRRSLITYPLPRLVYDEGMVCLPSCFAGHLKDARFKLLTYSMSIFEPSNVFNAVHGTKGVPGSSGLSFLGLLGLSPSDLFFFSRLDSFQAWYFSRIEGKRWERLSSYYCDHSCGKTLHSRSTFQHCMLRLNTKLRKCLHQRGALAESESTLVKKGDDRILENASLIRTLKGHIEKVRAVPCEVLCASSGFANQRKRYLQSDWENQVLFGLQNHQSKFWTRDDLEGKENQVSLYSKPLLSATAKVTGSGIQVKFYALAKALADGGKLRAFDKLLQELKAAGHRVLVFCQMTQMMNILEDYMIFRKLKYLRLDGSTKLEDRRDMVDAFQTQEDIFAFLLSTRAGGLGINLTAADTVIFYESDWNPTMDQQAMDRAHRLGQTKTVTVYRLICQGTIEEKILKRATQKEKVSKIVYNNKSKETEEGNDLSKEDVVSLLL